MKRITHDPEKCRCSHIMLEVQKSEEFPLEIEIDHSIFKLKDKESAQLFSLGMMAAIDAKNIEEDHEEQFDDLLIHEGRNAEAVPDDLG